MIAFISEHKDHAVGPHGLRWGVEPVCAVLTEHGVPIAASTYYEALTRLPSRRALRDEQVTALIAAERDSSRFVAGLGSRKMWLRLRRQGSRRGSLHGGAVDGRERLGGRALRQERAKDHDR